MVRQDGEETGTGLLPSFAPGPAVEWQTAFLVIRRSPHASAGTVSAQASTFARIASSSYEVRDTLLRVSVRS